MDDLRPCPFCGGKARYRTGCGVECSDCFANIVEARRIRDTVVTEWNRRADATALAEAQATIARQQAMLDRALESNGNLMIENARVKRLEAALQWCSGSDDFQEGGKAREGWLKVCAPLLDHTALSPREGEG